jgi:intracellular septation protein A
MFRLVTYEAWLDWVPFLAFGITALVFFTFLIRALRMKKESAEKMSRIPLD